MVTLKCIRKRKTAAANNAICFYLYCGSSKNMFSFPFPRYFLIVSRSVSNFVRVESEDQDFPVKPFFMTVSSGSFTCPPIYSLIKYVFTIYYVPGTALGTEMT